MTMHDDSLAYSLRVIWDYYLLSLVDEHEAAKFSRDWRANSRPVAAALARIGGRAWWLAREPYGPQDDTPYGLASVDPGTNLVRMMPASLAEIQGIPAAEKFRWTGEPLG